MRSDFQTAYRYDQYAVLRTFVCVVSGAGENHRERGCGHLVSVYLRGQGRKSGCTFLYKVMAAQFYFYKTVSAVSQMDDSIAFEMVLIPVVIDVSPECFGVDSEIPDA